MIKVHEVTQGSSEWHQLRAGKYTGSSADKLLKFGTIEYSRTTPADFKGNFYTKRGHILEGEAIKLYQRIKDVTVQLPGFVTNSKYPTCGYSPDGLLPDRTIEVKAFEVSRHRAMLGGDIPFKVLAQCYFGMFICDRKLCDLIIYNPELEVAEAFKVITVRSKPAVTSNLKLILDKEVIHA